MLSKKEILIRENLSLLIDVKNDFGETRDNIIKCLNSGEDFKHNFKLSPKYKRESKNINKEVVSKFLEIDFSQQHKGNDFFKSRAQKHLNSISSHILSECLKV